MNYIATLDPKWLIVFSKYFSRSTVGLPSLHFSGQQSFLH